jgi:hypothetical protein
MESSIEAASMDMYDPRTTTATTTPAVEAVALAAEASSPPAPDTSGRTDMASELRIGSRSMVRISSSHGPKVIWSVSSRSSHVGMSEASAVRLTTSPKTC